jgi:hypothetical protein
MNSISNESIRKVAKIRLKEQVEVAEDTAAEKFFSIFSKKVDILIQTHMRGSASNK